MAVQCTATAILYYRILLYPLPRIEQKGSQSEIPPYAVHLALVVALLYGFALVILMFSSRKRNCQFGKPLLVYEQTRGDNCETWVLHSLSQLAQLLAFEQQLAVAARRVVVVRPIEILGNVHVLHPQLIVYECAVGVDKARLGLPYRLYLRSRQHQAGRKGLGKDIVERGTLVLYVYVW